ncbi:MAG: DNA-binding protein, partial [Bacteroidales bacterium]|nr:DNA-binding protein [Bacteroidales bacterium]
MPRKTYTVKEVANLLGFSTNTVYKYLDEGKIKSTRLGSEGRFRIPDSEVSRLLQEVGLKSPAVQPQTNYLLPPKIVQGISSVKKNYGVPSLFDWFIGFLSIGLGFSQFILPSYNLNSSILNYLSVIRVLQGLLFVGGFFLISFDILKLKKDFWHKLAHIVLGLLYLTLSIMLFVSGSVPTAVGYFSASFVIFLTTQKHFPEYIRFLVYCATLYTLTGISIFIWPNKLLPVWSTNIVSGTLIPFTIVWSIGFVGLTVLGYLSVKKGGWSIKTLGVLITILAFAYAVLSFVNGYWERSIYAVTLGSFAMIFPFAEHFESFTLKSRREVVGSFAWLMGIFIIGSVVLYFVYRTFQTYSLSELANRAETASDILSTFMVGNVAKIAAFSGSNDVVNMMENQSKLTSGELDSHLRQIYQLSNDTLRRVVLVNDKGVIVNTYPFYPQSQNVDIAPRDYFTDAKLSEGTYITGIIKPSSSGIPPTVLISSPVYDKDHNFLGVLIGDVNLRELERRINQVKFGETGRVYVVDSNKKYVIGPTVDSVMQQVSN